MRGGEGGGVGSRSSSKAGGAGRAGGSGLGAVRRAGVGKSAAASMSGPKKGAGVVKGVARGSAGLGAVAKSAKTQRAVERHVPGAQVRKALKALKAHGAGKRAGAGKVDLLGDEDGEAEEVYVQVVLKKSPEMARKKAIRIVLPHSPHGAEVGAKGICLIVKDPEEAAREQVAAAGMAGEVGEVIGVSRLRSNYFPYEAKRQLCASYAVFMADDRVIPLLPHLLGKTFFKKKKQPIPLSLKAGGAAAWAREVRAALSAAYLHIREDTCFTLRVARQGMPTQDAVDNVLAGIEGAVSCVPGQWSNVQALYLRSTDSVSLPLFKSLPERGA